MVDRHGLGEGGDGALGGDIGGVAARARLGELRAHRHDRSRPGGDHRLDGVVDPEVGALDVDVESAVPGRLVDGVDRTAEGDAGRRHQDVDAAPFLHHMGDAAAHLLCAADVGRDGQRVAALGFDLVGEIEKSCFVEIDQRHAGAFRGKQAGRGGADPRRGSGHDGNAILELHGASLTRRRSLCQSIITWAVCAAVVCAAHGGPACSAPRSGRRRPWRHRCSPWAHGRPCRRRSESPRSSAGSPAPA